MTLTSYSEVLGAVRQWPLADQVSIAEELLRGLRLALTGGKLEAEADQLVPLTGLSRQELSALAGALVAPDRQQRLKVLLERNQRGDLSAAEQAELDGLLAEVDHVALLKARARYTLSLLANQETGR